MENTLFPENDAHVIFTDLQGIRREGIYKKQSNGYVESRGQESVEDIEYVYPEEDVSEWEYIDKKEH